MTYEKEMKIFKARVEIAEAVSTALLKQFPDYSYDDVNFNGKFILIDKCINMMIDEMSEGTLQRYSGCHACNEGCEDGGDEPTTK